MYVSAAKARISSPFKHNVSQTTYLSAYLLNVNLTQNFQSKIHGAKTQ